MIEDEGNSEDHSKVCEVFGPHLFDFNKQFVLDRNQSNILFLYFAFHKAKYYLDLDYK